VPAGGAEKSCEDGSLIKLYSELKFDGQPPQTATCRCSHRQGGPRALEGRQEKIAFGPTADVNAAHRYIPVRRGFLMLLENNESWRISSSSSRQNRGRRPSCQLDRLAPFNDKKRQCNRGNMVLALKVFRSACRAARPQAGITLFDESIQPCHGCSRCPPLSCGHLEARVCCCLSSRAVLVCVQRWLQVLYKEFWWLQLVFMQQRCWRPRITAIFQPQGSLCNCNVQRQSRWSQYFLCARWLA